MNGTKKKIPTMSLTSIVEKCRPHLTDTEYGLLMGAAASVAGLRERNAMLSAELEELYREVEVLEADLE